MPDDFFQNICWQRLLDGRMLHLWHMYHTIWKWEVRFWQIYHMEKKFDSNSPEVCSGPERSSWLTQIAKFMGPTWGPPGSCRPQMGPMLVPWTLLSGNTSAIVEEWLDADRVISHWPGPMMIQSTNSSVFQVRPVLTLLTDIIPNLIYIPVENWHHQNIMSYQMHCWSRPVDEIRLSTTPDCHVIWLIAFISRPALWILWAMNYPGRVAHLVGTWTNLKFLAHLLTKISVGISKVMLNDITDSFW